MATIIGFPVRDHGRASADSRRSEGRAAISASNSRVTPASCAVGDATTADQYSAGMLSRCSHLRAFAGGAPMSDAMAPGERQSSITARKDAGRSDMPPVLGHCVLKSKAEMSHDPEGGLPDNAGMADRMSEAEERAAFIGRVKLARLTRFPEGQKPILTILELDQGRYKQYESRTPLPWRFIPKFCAATGVSIEWLLTGEGKGPEIAEIPKSVPRRSRTLKTGRAA